MNNSPKILYAASTVSHLQRFHQPYIAALRENATVLTIAAGDGADFPIAFEKKIISPANLRAIRQVRRILQRERFDTVILNTSLAAFVIRAAMIGMKKRPYVLNIVHGYLFGEHGGGKNRLLYLCERMMRGVTDTVAVMNDEDFRIARTHSLCRGDVRMIAGMGCPMPSAPPVPEEALRTCFAPDGKDFLCTFVGELSRRKNQVFLIRAVGRLRAEGLPVRLLLIGEGSERGKLEQEIRALGLSDSVFLIGNREPVQPYLAITDLYVSASRSEGLPFNIMEAMICGLPVLASDTKGQNDLLSDSPDALYSAGDTDAFCTALRRWYMSGKHGVNACSYPNLTRYRLDAVLEDNLKLMRTGGNQ